MPLKPSARGMYLLVVPVDFERDLWRVMGFRLSGRWCYSSAPWSKEKAQRERASLMRHHRKLAAERATRAAKRLWNRTRTSADLPNTDWS